MLSQTISNIIHLWALSTAVGLAVGFPVGCCSETRSSFGPALKNGGLPYLLPIRCLGWHRSVHSHTNLVGGGPGHGPLGSMAQWAFKILLPSSIPFPKPIFFNDFKWEMAVESALPWYVGCDMTCQLSPSFD